MKIESTHDCRGGCFDLTVSFSLICTPASSFLCKRSDLIERWNSSKCSSKEKEKIVARMILREKDACTEEAARFVMYS